MKAQARFGSSASWPPPQSRKTFGGVSFASESVRTVRWCGSPEGARATSGGGPPDRRKERFRADPKAQGPRCALRSFACRLPFPVARARLHPGIPEGRMRFPGAPGTALLDPLHSLRAALSRGGRLYRLVPRAVDRGGADARVQRGIADRGAPKRGVSYARGLFRRSGRSSGRPDLLPGRNEGPRKKRAFLATSAAGSGLPSRARTTNPDRHDDPSAGAGGPARRGAESFLSLTARRGRTEPRSA